VKTVLEAGNPIGAHPSGHASFEQTFSHGNPLAQGQQGHANDEPYDDNFSQELTPRLKGLGRKGAR
jgi:hypothetical protein